MKKKSIITLCFVVVCAILLNYVAFIGFNIAGFSYGGMFGETGIKKGIDLAGGSVITFQADADAPTDYQMQVVESIFQTRMTNAGYTEARISQGEGGKITVEIPSVFETDQAASLLGDTAKLTFNDADGNVILDGATDIKNASYQYGKTSQTGSAQSYVQVEFNAEASLLAAAIGIILIMIFMVIMYRIPGLIADISLLIYVGLIGLAMGIFHVNLSLSGIAGIVLSIGMAVDADCIIFERMKEELKVGKTIRASVSAGFDKAFSAILDSNITTIISCVVLYISGIGAVTGFATTLGIGVILSMFTAIVITKFLLKQLVGIGIENRSLFYNAKAKKGGAEE